MQKTRNALLAQRSGPERGGQLEQHAGLEIPAIAALHVHERGFPSGFAERRHQNPTILYNRMRRLRRHTAFEIDLGFDSFTGQCYAEVRAIGVICVGPSETEALEG